MWSVKSYRSVECQACRRALFWSSTAFLAVLTLRCDGFVTVKFHLRLAQWAEIGDVVGENLLCRFDFLARVVDQNARVFVADRAVFAALLLARFDG